MKKTKLFFIGIGLFLVTLLGCPGNVEPTEPPKPEVKQDNPVFSPAGGFFKESKTVTITCEGASEIYYTILKPTFDSSGKWNEAAWKEAVASSLPTKNSTKYTGPFTVDGQCIIRAAGLKSDGSMNYAMTSFDFDLDRSTDFDGSWTPVNPDSENWQDQIIYFILTDRFFNGDTGNDRTAGLTDSNGTPYDESKVLVGQPASGYNGGDIEGIRQKLQYIKDLGFTAIWLTPPIKCQVAESNYHGYHGYWASDFTKVDPHMGTLEQYQKFVKEAHDKGLYVIQDIVVNHLGDYQQIKKDISAEHFVDGRAAVPKSDFFLEPKSVPLSHPEQLPWALNNINDLTYDEWKNNSFYHYNTEISDYTNQINMYTHSTSNLDDMVTENEVVRHLLRGYFRYWIDKVGIDGYRIDTALYVEPEFFEGFINDTDPQNMGVREYGISKGKKDFINFGEAFSQHENVCGSYTKSKDGTARMDSMLYFPLRYAVADTISSGGKTSAISEILKARYTKNYYKDPSRLVTFIDNHDIDRWGQTMKGNTELMKAAYGIIYTIPGIPQVYYGSEQGFDGECREGMFKGSYRAPGEVQDSDRFDTGGDWYEYFKSMNKMRKENRVFRYNSLYVLQDTKDSAGIFAYVVRERDPAKPNDMNAFLAGVGNKAIYVMNTSSSDKILDASYTGIVSGEKYKLIEYDGVSVCPAAGTSLEDHFVVGKDSLDASKGNVKAIVPANSCAIYILSETGVPASTGVCELSVDEVPSAKVVEDTITIKGTTSVTGDVKVVLNGDYSLATVVSATADTQFSLDVNIKSLSNGKIPVQLIQIVGGEIFFSNTKSFTIERPFKLIARYDDPADDDNGVGAAKGILQRPTDPPFAGTMDMRGVEVYRSGNDILLGLRMAALSHGWNPTSNEFDHTVFYIFVSNGDEEGCEYHPKSNYKLPSAFGKWDYMYQANGWGQAFYSAKNASATNLGTAVTPAPVNSPGVDWSNLKDDEVEGVEKYCRLDWSSYSPQIGDEFVDKPGMIWFKISAASIGYPNSLENYRFYVNTWDFDMGSPRGMKEGDAERYKFGSGTLPVNSVPMVCDELDTVIVISE